MDGDPQLPAGEALARLVVLRRRREALHRARRLSAAVHAYNGALSLCAAQVSNARA